MQRTAQPSVRRRERLDPTQKKPEGALKVSVPVILGQEPFYEFLSAFLKKYPGIQLDLFITNLFVDLIADNIDVAIRFGELADSSIIAKRIGRSVRYLVASPKYLKGRTVPSKPEDLRNHQCILLNGRNNEAEWHLVSGRKSVKLRVTGPVSSRDFQSVSAFTYKGHGIGLCRRTIARSKSGSASSCASCRRGRRRRSLFMPSIRRAASFHPSFRFS